MKTALNEKKSIALLSLPVLVAALGYFVDIYDLLLFLVVRVGSLQEIGLSPQQIADQGKDIIGHQMVGLLIGGILWGMLGDKKGRLSVLFGSILLYSLANMANGLVQTLPQYSLCRFIAGIGLAGELGAGITLVSELLPKERRGVATSFVAGIGLLGAVAAYFVAQIAPWRVCYFVGGGMGLALLAMRVTVFESSMYEGLRESSVGRGNFLAFFSNGKRFWKYLKAILIGLPTWFVIGILVGFCEEFATAMGIEGKVEPGRAVMYAYAAISIGDILIGLISQQLRSRKKALFIFYGITMAAMAYYFSLQGGTPDKLYLACALLGFGTGFWAIFVTMAAEQFGTNLRATAATTVPNMVRGSLPLLVMLFRYLDGALHSKVQAGMITGGLVMAITIVAAALTEETFGKDLDFVEE